MHKCSFVDYPGKLAAVVFTPGCNFNCPFCHNRGLLGEGAAGEIAPQAVLDFLNQRHGMLDGLVVTGGEPTCQSGLGYFCKLVKRLGFSVKLDTNGSDPAQLRRLIAEKAVDYVAMDVKAPLDRYGELAGAPVDTAAVGESIDCLLGGRVDYEFRTTVAPQLGTEDIQAIAARIAGARRYALQPFRTNGSAELADLGEALSAERLEQLAPRLLSCVDEVLLRGADGRQSRFVQVAPSEPLESRETEPSKAPTYQAAG